MSALGFIAVLIILPILLFLGWIFYSRLRAQQAGLPPPPWSSYIPFKKSSSSNYPSGSSSSAGGSIVERIKSTFSKLTNKRSAAGAYETPYAASGSRSNATAPRRGLDPDEAWDTRVGNEADAYGPPGGGYGYGESDDEENGIGMHTYNNNNAHGSAMPSYDNAGATQGQGHSTKSTAYVGGSPAGLDRRYDEEMHGGPTPTAQNPNPFDERVAEESHLGDKERAIRPGMHERGVSRDTMASVSTTSAKSERRSMFREGL